MDEIGKYFSSHHWFRQYLSSICCADQYGNCNIPFPGCTENGKTQRYLLQKMRRLLPNLKERPPR
jgi:hypothetical protein